MIFFPPVLYDLNFYLETLFILQYSVMAKVHSVALNSLFSKFSAFCRMFTFMNSS